ncbi:MAG TPA: hypothetical protein VNA25_16440 [Phycisphaerae bacterium]|nr:hypothetical protein [Phycisphaerae bacterium]
MVDELTLMEQDLSAEFEQAADDPQGAAFQKRAASAKLIDVRELKAGVLVDVYSPYFRHCRVTKKRGLSALVESHVDSKNEKGETVTQRWHEVWAMRDCQYRNKKTGAISEIPKLVVTQDSRSASSQQGSTLVARNPKDQQPWRFEMSVVEGIVQEATIGKAEDGLEENRKPSLAKAKG